MADALHLSICVTKQNTYKVTGLLQYLHVSGYVTSVMWSLIKGNESHGTVNPAKKETTQIISLLMWLTFY